MHPVEESLARVFTWSADSSVLETSASRPREHTAARQLLPPFLSAGGQQATRLAGASRTRLFMASHATVYSLQLTYPDEGSLGPQEDRDGISGVIDNLSFQSIKVHVLPPASSAQTEIQSLAVCPPGNASVVASVDSRRVAHVYQQDKPLVPPSSIPPAKAAMQGWAGLGFDPHDSNNLAVVGGLAKTLDVRDLQAGAVVNTWATWQHPTAVMFCGLGPGDKSVIAVGEHSTVSFYDPRSPSHDACLVKDQSGPRGLVWALSMGLGPQDLVAAGEDRALYVYDVRVMKLRARFRSASKHDIVGIYPSSCQPDRLYVAGLDNEILPCSLTGARKGGGVQKRPAPGGEGGAGSTSTGEEGATATADGQQPRSHAPLPSGSRLHESHHLGIKADARWVGVAAVPAREETGCDDVLVGLSDRGSLYTIVGAQHMHATLAMQGP